MVQASAGNGRRTRERMKRGKLTAAGLLVLPALIVSCRRPIPPAADRDAIAGKGSAIDLLAPDAQVLEDGKRETLDEYLGGHLPADIAFAQAVQNTRTAMIVRQEGTTAWTTETSQSNGRFNSREIDSIGTELMVLSRTPEGWRIRAIHWSGHANR
jgi:hypothetical protein